MVWVLVCRGDTHHARQIIGPDDEDQEEEDDPIPPAYQKEQELESV